MCSNWTEQDQLRGASLVLKDDFVDFGFRKILYKDILGWNSNLCSKVLICKSKWLHSRKDRFQDQKCNVVGP